MTRRNKKAARRWRPLAPLDVVRDSMLLAIRGKAGLERWTGRGVLEAGVYGRTSGY